MHFRKCIVHSKCIKIKSPLKCYNFKNDVHVLSFLKFYKGGTYKRDAP